MRAFTGSITFVGSARVGVRAAKRALLLVQVKALRLSAALVFGALVAVITANSLRQNTPAKSRLRGIAAQALV